MSSQPPEQLPDPGSRSVPSTPRQARPIRQSVEVLASPSHSEEVALGVAAGSGVGEVVTARRAGGLRDMSLQIDPEKVGIPAALQNLAKAINIAFQTDYGENYLESVYQAALVRRGEVHVIHREYFGFGESWMGQFGMLMRSMQLSTEGPDPVSPEGMRRIAEKGPSTIRGLFNLIGRKLDLVAEFEDRVPGYVEQMLDRLEASGIIIGWDRGDWEIQTTRIGLNIRLAPRCARMQHEVSGKT